MPVVDRRRVTFFTSKKVTKEGRQRTLRRVLWNPREYLAKTRELPPLPTGTPAVGTILVAGAPNNGCRKARRGHTAENTAPFRAFARLARVRGKAAQFSASPWALRATQTRPCLPGSSSGTVPETRRQRHCARGAAAGGMLYTRPFIRGRGASDFGRRPTGGGAGVKGIWPQAILIENPARRAGSAKRTQAGAAGRSARERPSRVARSGRSPGRPPKPLAASFPHFLSVQEMGPPAGAGPGKLYRSLSGEPKVHRRSTTDRPSAPRGGISKTAVGRPPTSSAAH